MATKKIKLKSSITAINTKANLGKRKALPKLKVILENPYKPQHANLSAADTSELKDHFEEEIQKSCLSGREFAKQNKICLGLESSLRAINNKQVSCVLISKAIKPKFIVDQIAYLTRVKNRRSPVYVVEGLEAVLEPVFGIKALIVVFPVELPGTLAKWTSHRMLPKRDVPDVKHTVTPSMVHQPKFPNKVNLETIFLPTHPNKSRAFIPETVVKYEMPVTVETSKEWTGDFISFSSKSEHKKVKQESQSEFETKRNKAINALKRLTSSTRKGKESKNNDDSKQKPEQMECEESEEDNDLDSPMYLGLEVRKIVGNPNRKKKAKRKKKKLMQSKL